MKYDAEIFAALVTLANKTLGFRECAALTAFHALLSGGNVRSKEELIEAALAYADALTEQVKAPRKANVPPTSAPSPKPQPEPQSAAHEDLPF